MKTPIKHLALFMALAYHRGRLDAGGMPDCKEKEKLVKVRGELDADKWISAARALSAEAFENPTALKLGEVLLAIVGLALLIPTAFLAAPTVLNPMMTRERAEREKRLSQWNCLPMLWCIAQFAARGDTSKIHW